MADDYRVAAAYKELVAAVQEYTGDPCAKVYVYVSPTLDIGPYRARSEAQQRGE